MMDTTPGSGTPTRLSSGWRWAIGSLVVFLGVLATASVVRSVMFLREINYNEGWNVYNAVACRQHVLYPVTLSYVSNNYPALSFALLSLLERVTHDYLFTGRIVSVLALILTCFCVTGIGRLLHCSTRASSLAGLFCYFVFVFQTTGTYGAAIYIGADDPTMLGICLTTLGLYFYLLARNKNDSTALLVTAALFFILSLSVKQTFLDFPVVALMDLFLRSRKNFFVLLSALTLSGLASLALQLRFAGAGLLVQLTAPRTYVSGRSSETFVNVFGPLLYPALAAAACALLIAGNKSLRVVSFLLGASVVFGLFVGRAEGVTYNCFFTSYISCSLLVGVIYNKMEHEGWLSSVPNAGACFAATTLLWFLVPLTLYGTVNPVREFHQARLEEEEFNRQLSIIQAADGPAICESLLRCYLAGKPYLYDPFNATRLIRAGRLEEQPLVAKLDRRFYRVVELSDPVEVELTYHSEHFTPVVLEAIQQNYVLIYRHGRECLYLARS